jgi:hypothetical protein
MLHFTKRRCIGSTWLVEATSALGFPTANNLACRARVLSCHRCCCAPCCYCCCTRYASEVGDELGVPCGGTLDGALPPPLAGKAQRLHSAHHPRNDGGVNGRVPHHAARADLHGGMGGDVDVMGAGSERNWWLGAGSGKERGKWAQGAFTPLL